MSTFGRTINKNNVFEENVISIPSSHKDDTLTDKLLSLCERGDIRSQRNLANLAAKERLYRRIFCKQTITNSNKIINSEDDNIYDIPFNLSLGKKDFIYFTCKDEEGGNDVSYLTNNSKKNHLTLRSLCDHIRQLLVIGYSLNYILSYLSFLRKKYKDNFPIERERMSSFLRGLNDCYLIEVKKKSRISTDQIYTSDEIIYTNMFKICWDNFFSEASTKGVSSISLIRFSFVYIFMHETGKRLSEVCSLTPNDLSNLLEHRLIAIKIPKTQKMGRISLRDFSKNELDRFLRFIKRGLFLFKKIYLNVIPFNQYSKRRSLDRFFSNFYNCSLDNLATNNLLLISVSGKKPRGLSLHSLRRCKAARLFENGHSIEEIRECLDHSNTKITNMYINKHLIRTYKYSSDRFN